LAITASSNDHVDRINAAIQRSRVDTGDINPDLLAPIAGFELACVGDVIVTRRNDRRLTTTTTDDLVRNRETWTVTHIADDRSITASSNEGTGTIVLPAEDAVEHVHLGYAATEHGNQGDTTHAAIELVSDHTARRGLYVGATRGRKRPNGCSTHTDQPSTPHANASTTRNNTCGQPTRDSAGPADSSDPPPTAPHAPPTTPTTMREHSSPPSKNADDPPPRPSPKQKPRSDD